MNLKNFLGAAGAVATLAFAGSAIAQNKTVNVYNWVDYIGETTLQDFEKATGIKPNYSVFSSLEELEAKLLTGNSGYDVIVPTAEPTLAKLMQAKAVRKLDKSKIPNLKNLDPELSKLVQGTDPGNEYAAIYQWGTIGIGYNAEAVKKVAPDVDMTSWDSVFKPENAAKLAKCGIVFLDSQTDMLPTVYHYLKLDPNSEKAEDLKKVEETMLGIRPHIRAFVDSIIDPLASGQACVGIGYSGDVFQAAARAEEAKNGSTIEYVIPKEGAQVWFDVMAIPVDAPNADAAYAWINYMLEPQTMAGISNFVAYANAVPASWPLMDQAVAANPKIFPPAEVKKNLFTVKQVSPRADRDRTRSWTRIQTGK